MNSQLTVANETQQQLSGDNEKLMEAINQVGQINYEISSININSSSL